MVTGAPIADATLRLLIFSGMPRLSRLLLGGSALIAAPLLALPAGLSLPLAESPALCPTPSRPSGATRVAAAAASRVIVISVDGLRPDAVAALGPAGAPVLHRMRADGASTHNARADWSRTVTVPNHASMLTGRGVEGRCGHGWTGNVEPEPGETLHTNRGAYVASLFDVAHDAGRRTALFASKSKFQVFDLSYASGAGRADSTGVDDGPDKLDHYAYLHDTDALTDSLVRTLQSAPFDVAVLHLRDPDSKGHKSGWDLSPGSPYLSAVRAVDGLVGRVLAAIERDPDRVRTTVILTADHGGLENGHGGASDVESFTVPFYVWGAGVAEGADLYLLNPSARDDPGTERPAYSDTVQPVRNGDAANLALDLLGLASVPGSTINADDAPLRVR